jgi:hypothetical protein
MTDPLLSSTAKHPDPSHLREAIQALALIRSALANYQGRNLEEDDLLLDAYTHTRSAQRKLAAALKLIEETP